MIRVTVIQKHFLVLIMNIGFLTWFSCAYSQTLEQLTEFVEAEPVKVGIALELHQIVSINQREENFMGVVTLHSEYQDPLLAYKWEESDPPFRMYHLQSFLKLLLEKKATWPEIIIDNQQGRKHASTEIITLAPNGTVRYLERSTITFQTPDMDFRRFPFDEQIFKIDLTLLFPTDMYMFEELPAISGVDDALGEEEWVVSDVATRVSTILGRDNLERSRFSLVFEAHRHVTYYLVRIFIPAFIILLVTWFTFLLRDYVKRVDVGITTLLLFIAFNFAVSSDLPRLGYVTAMDAFLTGTFTITGIVLLVNVIFRRLETSGHAELAARLDKYAITLYWPAYIIGLSVTFLWL